MTSSLPRRPRFSGRERPEFRYSFRHSLLVPLRFHGRHQLGERDAKRVCDQPDGAPRGVRATAFHASDGGDGQPSSVRHLFLRDASPFAQMPQGASECLVDFT